MVGKTLAAIFMFLFVLTLIASIFYLETHAFVFGTLMLIDVAIYMRWVCSEKGSKELNELPIENDPCGNDNIKPREPWEYL